MWRSQQHSSTATLRNSVLNVFLESTRFGNLKDLYMPRASAFIDCGRQRLKFLMRTMKKGTVPVAIYAFRTMLVNIVLNIKNSHIKLVNVQYIRLFITSAYRLKEYQTRRACPGRRHFTMKDTVSDETYNSRPQNVHPPRP